ncbi:MAG: hypothetical protein K2I00_05630 [Ruminococcus sp.]|nr:hypothetical protein [Ruminococcus sp.]
MADSKLSLEDILKEYSRDEKDGVPVHVNRAEAQKILNSTIVRNSEKRPDAPKPVISHKKNELFDGNSNMTVPANEIAPQEVSSKVSAVVDSAGINNVKSNAPENVSAPEEISVADESTKIRRMADSTRARERAKERKNQRKRKNKKSGQSKKVQSTYKKETAQGEYMYTPPVIKKKKRTRQEIIAEAESPEGRKHITDIVPSPKALAATQSINAPRAKKTSINLSARNRPDASGIDINLAPNDEEYEEIVSTSKRTKRIVDFNYYGDVQDVGRDIYELKNILKTRVSVLALTSFISLYMTVCSRFRFPIADFLSIDNIFTYLLVHLGLGLISVIYSIPVITKGLKNLFTMKADGDSMTSVTAVTCIISLLTAFLNPDMARAEMIHIYMPLGILALFTNSLGKFLILKRAQRNFKFVSKSFDRHAVVYVRDEERAERLTHGTLGDFPILAAMRPTDFLTDFLRYTYSSDITDSFCKKVTPICLVVSLLTSVFLTFFRMGTLISLDAAAFGISIFSMLICAGSCIALPFSANLPLESVSKQTLKNDGILLGYQSVDDLYDTNCILASADTLFPNGTVRLGGIKVFGNTKLDEALVDAASLTYHSGSVLRQLFSDITHGKENMLYNIENFSIEEGMGICGWINNRRMLLGNRELMASHNIEGVLSKSQEAEYTEGHEAMYLSISGNVAALFVVDVIADRNIRLWAERLVKKKICIIVKKIDPFLTRSKIAKVLRIPKEMVRVIPQSLHNDFDAETSKQVRISASMACTGKFTSMAQLILGIKNVHSSAIKAIIIQTASIILGFGLSLMLILSKAFESNYIYMSATAMVVYNLVCTIVTVIAARSRKN